jgi:plasmid stabilization system protein ParE
LTYRLRVTARAAADADEAYAWIPEILSPDQAESWYQGLFKQMETLRRQPTRCPRAAESERFPNVDHWEGLGYPVSLAGSSASRRQSRFLVCRRHGRT